MDGHGPPQIGDVPYAPLTAHVQELKENLAMARREVQSAREKALENSQIQFYSERIEEKFHPGELVRYFLNVGPKKSRLDGCGNEETIGEISKLKLKNRLYTAVAQVSPTTYSLKDPDSGKMKDKSAHGKQLARVRFPAVPRLGASASTWTVTFLVLAGP